MKMRKEHGNPTRETGILLRQILKLRLVTVCTHRLSSVVRSACISTAGLAWDLQARRESRKPEQGLCIISVVTKEI